MSRYKRGTTSNSFQTGMGRHPILNLLPLLLSSIAVSSSSYSSSFLPPLSYQKSPMVCSRQAANILCYLRPKPHEQPLTLPTLALAQPTPDGKVDEETDLDRNTDSGLLPMQNIGRETKGGWLRVVKRGKAVVWDLLRMGKRGKEMVWPRGLLRMGKRGKESGGGW